MTTIYIGLVYFLAILYALKKKEGYLIGLLLLYFIIFIYAILTFEELTAYDYVYGPYHSNQQLKEDIIIQFFSKIFMYVLIFLPLFNIIFNSLISMSKKSK